MRAHVQRLNPRTRAANTLAILRAVPALAVALAVVAPLVAAAAIPGYWPMPVATACVGAALEYRNILFVLRLSPREPGRIDLFATRPFGLVESAPLWAFVARFATVFVLILHSPFLMKPTLVAVCGNGDRSRAVGSDGAADDGQPSPAAWMQWTGARLHRRAACLYKLQSHRSGVIYAAVFASWFALDAAAAGVASLRKRYCAHTMMHSLSMSSSQCWAPLHRHQR